LTNGQGAYSVEKVGTGRYSLAVSATGFATEERLISVSGDEQAIEFKLPLASVAEEVVVESEDNSSLAVQLAPVKALLDAGSARTEISSFYIAQYTSPVTDFADIIQAAPGTVSYTTNGIGNGQAKIFFRGFVDDDYTMTWDGVPFNDSNDPSHHSWAYIPAAAVGYVDFDRSPGTASDIGPSNFGGSIHFFSPKLGDEPHFKIQETFGSWNTNQILGDINSGDFMKGKAHFWLNSDYQDSDGYQTFSPKQDVAATAKLDYKFSDRTNLTVTASHIMLDAFNNNDPTRRQLFHHGDNYLYDNNMLNADGTYNAQYWRYSVYHVPSFFDVVTYNHDYGKGWKLDTKSYTYGYSNHQHYQNTTDNDQITDAVLTKTIEEAVGGDDQPAGPNYDKKPTGVDKLNQYGRGGVIGAISYATKWGVLRFGSWYEYTNTLRYQVYTDPITWVDSPFISNIKFHEHYLTYSTQPYIEFQLVSIPRWTITAGLKDSYYAMHLTQYADGKTVGALGCPTGSTPISCTNTVIHSQAYNAFLPSVEANYRINNDWSAYGQYGRGSIAPFSSVFDTTGALVAVTPPLTIANTIQGGTVVKLKRFAFDADVYRIHFTNTYSTYTPSSGPDIGFTYYYANPDSNTTGFEAEGNVAVTHSLSFNANGTFGVAKYVASSGSPAVTDASGNVINPAVPATPESWVASAPHDTESMGLVYREKGLDLGIFGKRVGSRWADIGNDHQTVPEDPFWMSNLFVNYNIHGRSIFDGSKIKFSINNIFDDHSIVAIGAANDGTTLAAPYTKNTALQVTQDNQLYTPSWADTQQKQAGRSFMVSFQLGLTKQEK
jgi:iron complex outermembrane recepter protein